VTPTASLTPAQSTLLSLTTSVAALTPVTPAVAALTPAMVALAPAETRHQDLDQRLQGCGGDVPETGELRLLVVEHVHHLIIVEDREERERDGEASTPPGHKLGHASGYSVLAYRLADQSDLKPVRGPLTFLEGKVSRQLYS
jgi:hypothetical protein